MAGERGDVIIASTVGATAKFKDAWGMGAGAEGGVTRRWGGEVGRGGHGGVRKPMGQQAKQFNKS